MKHTPSDWTHLEQRLRREPASPPPPADAVPRLLRAVRRAAPEPATHVATRSSLWGLGAAAAAALALVLALQRPAPQSPPPAAPGAAANWSLATLDAAAAAPLQQEWDGLQRDLQALAGHVVSCLPAAGAWTPPG